MKERLSYLMIPILWILPGCSAFRMVNRYIDQKFEKSGLELRTIESPNFHIEYWDNNAEDRPVFLVLHGFGASAKYQWFKQLKVLSNDYRVIIPNLMYFGNSRPKSEKYSISDQINLVQELLGELKVTNYSIMGASYGGLLTLEMSNKYPEQVDRIIIVDAPIKFMYPSDIKRICDSFNEEKIENIFIPKEPIGMRKLLYITRGKETFVPQFILKDFHSDFYTGPSREGKIKLMQDLVESHAYLENRVYNIEVPVLLIWGETDLIIPPDRGALLHEYLGSNSEFHIIEDGGHMPNINKSKVFNRILRDFLATSE